MRIEHRLTMTDTYQADEPTRMIVAGCPGLPGVALAGRPVHLRDDRDLVRPTVMTEPCGHRDMAICLPVGSVYSEADVAALFIDGRQHAELTHVNRIDLAMHRGAHRDGLHKFARN